MSWTRLPDIIIGDNSHRTYSRSEIPGNAVVYAASDSDLAKKVKFKPEEKLLRNVSTELRDIFKHILNNNLSLILPKSAFGKKRS